MANISDIEAYARGFVKSANAHGVDPVALAKYAQDHATPFTDYAMGGVPRMMLGSNPITAPIAVAADNVGYIAGLMSVADNSHKTILPAAIPGVGGFRMGNRIKTQVLREIADIKKKKEHKDAKPVAHAIAEHLGGGTSMLASLGLGAGIGGLLGKGKGALLGAGIAGGTTIAANLIGTIAAAIKKRRTKEEQIESDKRSVLKKYLVPGTAIYDYWKRMGRSQGEREEVVGKNKDKNENKNKEDK